MAKIIEFYVPARHHPERRRTPESARGKLLEFPSTQPAIFVQLADSALWPLTNLPAPQASAAANVRRPLAWTAK